MGKIMFCESVNGKCQMKCHKYYFIFFVLLNCISTLTAFGQENKQQPNYLLENVFVTTEDKIKLSTDVYLPLTRNVQLPCVLSRTPYNKEHFKADAEWFTNKGIVFVGQDCRGKFLSEGQWYPLRYERCDGLATTEWVRKQSWSNGKIGGWGGSYLGYCQWAISDKLDVLTPQYTGADWYDLIYPGGLFSLATVFNWGFVVDAQTVNTIPPEKLIASYTILPLSIADDSTYRDSKFINDWLSHSFKDEYWKSQNHKGITKSPIISIGGWYDIFLMAQTRYWGTTKYALRRD